MKRSHWKLLIVGVLFLTLGAPQAFARGMGGAPHPSGGGGGGGSREGGGARSGPPSGGGAGREGGGARGGSPGGGSAGREGPREGNSGGGPRGGSSVGGGNRAGGYGEGGASNAARNPAFSNANTNRNQSGATGKQGAAAGAAYANRNQSAYSGKQGAAAGAAYANRNQPRYSGAQGAAAGAAAAGYHPSSENYGFYHGSYNGNWGGAAAYGAVAVARPLAWGMGAWGSGASMYNSGYLGYSNPYYSSAGGGGGGGYDYSQPIPVASNTQAAAPPDDPNAGQTAAADSAAGESPEDQLNPAIDAFKKGDNDTALKVVNTLIQKSPNDAVLHEFRALVLFAKHDYKQAAATIHSVLAVGPGWDWTTLSSLYSDIEIYNKQLQALESFVENHAQDGAAHFLLAYHYLTCGHPDSAAEEFQQVVKLVPTDKVAADLLKMVAPPQEGNNQPPEPANSKPTSKPVDPATLVGTWKATRDDGSTFELALPKDLSFTWKFSQKQKSQEFSGTYSVEGNLLVLNRQDGSSLVGQMTPDGQKKFNFKILGGPSDDPGLNFVR